MGRANACPPVPYSTPVRSALRYDRHAVDQYHADGAGSVVVCRSFQLNGYEADGTGEVRWGEQTPVHPSPTRRPSDLPFGTTVMQLTNIMQTEPDPSLFVVPSNYTVTTRTGRGR